MTRRLHLGPPGAAGPGGTGRSGAQGPSTRLLPPGHVACSGVPAASSPVALSGQHRVRSPPRSGCISPGRYKGKRGPPHLLEDCARNWPHCPPCPRWQEPSLGPTGQTTALVSTGVWHSRGGTQPPQHHPSPFRAMHLALSVKALAATSRSCFRPFRFSMMLLPWMPVAVHSISATSRDSSLQDTGPVRRETTVAHLGSSLPGSWPLTCGLHRWYSKTGTSWPMSTSAQGSTLPESEPASGTCQTAGIQGPGLLRPGVPTCGLDAGDSHPGSALNHGAGSHVARVGVGCGDIQPVDPQDCRPS